MFSSVKMFLIRFPLEVEEVFVLLVERVALVLFKAEADLLFAVVVVFFEEELFDFEFAFDEVLFEAVDLFDFVPLPLEVAEPLVVPLPLLAFLVEFVEEFTVVFVEVSVVVEGGLLSGPE